ncbi:MAG: 4-hydroxythreonine-4-phosphate dehydrogenase PdxA [Candidatus Aureabacteria bacterium]|nr:4-hydroxythreonine-4-phosphate dehydrogenase PdxA [Candidatus Auribacterota bacterium]
MKISNPKIGITFGDISGIGPEVIIKALHHPKLNKKAEYILLGHPDIYEKACRLVRHGRPKVPHSFFGRFFHGTSEEKTLLKSFSPGKISRVAGCLAIRWIEQGVEACREGLLNGLVTAPINKQACHKAGFHFKGHTDFIADLCGNPSHRMMFYSKALKVILVTHHQSLVSSIQDLSVKNIVETILIGNQAMKQFGYPNPVIHVSGLNPHASENSAFGDEEKRIIRPAVETARKIGFNVKGPYPPDTLFRQFLNKENTLIVAMNHDQGLIPLKLAAFDSAVNVTAGLPIIRTSPDHGTAYDIAWKGIAGETSMVEAINLAVRMAGNRG